MVEWSIGEVAQRAGVRASALRSYERERLLEPARRVSGRRRYAPDVLDRLRVIRRAQAVGFSVAEVRELMRGFTPATSPTKRWHGLARRKLADVIALHDRALRMERILKTAIRCHCPRLTDCTTLLDDDAGAPPARTRRRRHA